MMQSSSRLPSALLGWLLSAAVGTTLAGDVTGGLADLPLEDLVQVEVSSASKFAQKTRQAPAAVQILDAEDIRRHGWRTLTEALVSLPGLYSVSDRAYDFVGARGFLVPGDYNTRFLLLLDGQRLNDNIYEQANFGHEFQIDMELIERIEYIPGPGSSIYGSNAVFGVINVITRKARSLPGLGSSVRVGSDGWREARLAGSRFGGGDGPDVVASFSHARKYGRDLAYPDAAGLATANASPSPDGMTHGLDRSEVTRAFVSVAQGGFSSSAWAARREVNPSSALYGTNFDDGRLKLVDASYGVRAAYHAALGEHWNLDGRLAFQKLTYRADYPYFDATAGAYVNRDDTVGTWWSGEARTLYTGFARHKLLAGIEFSADRRATQKNADVDVAINLPLDVDTSGHRQGVYVQDDWNFAPAWRLNAGLRRDSFSSGRANTSPRLGLLWDASERTTFKLLAGRAYRVANAYETAYASNINYLANFDLRPEMIRTREAVGEFRLADGIQFGASLFEYRIDNLIRLVDTGGGVMQYRNQPEISARGVELHYQQRRNVGPSLFASLALNQTRDADGNRLGNSPHWIAKLRGSQPLLGDRMVAALELNAIGRRTLDWQGSRDPLGSQLLVNATLTATRLAPGLEAQLRVLNLLDRPLRHPASNEAPLPTLPLDGRRWQFGLSYAF